MESITIGLLHSQTGTMAFSETPLLEAELLAIDDINCAGGILGRTIEPIIEDGASDPDVFSRKAYKLIGEKNVTTIFGGWNSHTRKAVKHLVEKYDALFWYPMQYEGLEESPNIFYSGSCLNQQIQPALEWCLDQGWHDFFLVGSDYIYPITANLLIKSILMYNGGTIVGETYVPLGHTDFTSVIGNIQNTKPQIIINTLNGDSNICFFSQYHSDIFNLPYPILSTSVAEHECRQIGDGATGHFTCWNYFQCMGTPENRRFIQHFRDRYGEDRVISDPIVMAYSQLFMWKRIVESASSFDVRKIQANAAGQRFSTPAGSMMMMSNHHLTKPQTCIGRCVKPGEFDIVWQTGAHSQPLPWFGIEQLVFPSSHLIKDIMKVFPETVNFNMELEHQVKIRTKELARSEQRLRDVFETMMEGIISISPTGEIIQANAEAQRILGLKHMDILMGNNPFPVWDIIRPDESPMPTEEMAVPRAFREMRPVRDVVTGIVLDDHSICWIKICATPLLNNDGKFDGIIVTLSDITQSKKMWDELQKTQRLESLSVLAGGIAHDFNNLLGGIFGNIDLAIDAIDDKEMALRYLDTGISALKRARSLTRQLMTFSKGGSPIKTAVDIEPLLNESLSLSLSGSHIISDVSIEPKIGTFDADPNQISQVLNNMILNARQAMPEGGTLSVKIYSQYLADNQINELKEGKYIEISIRDEGPGIPKPLLTRIFDPFFTTKAKGNGLGLSMCYSIISKHNGTIQVDSVEGKGTTFTIYLPASLVKKCAIYA